MRQFLTKPEEVFELEKAIDGNAPVAYIILLFLKYWTSYNSNPTFNQLVNKLRAINLNDTAGNCNNLYIYKLAWLKFFICVQIFTEKFETNRDFLLQVSEPINANIQAVHQRHKTATGASNTQVKLNHQCIILTFVVLITAVIIGVYIACYNWIVLFTLTLYLTAVLNESLYVMDKIKWLQFQ